jgi:hypothetical protein
MTELRRAGNRFDFRKRASSGIVTLQSVSSRVWVCAVPAANCDLVAGLLSIDEISGLAMIGLAMGGRFREKSV